MANERAIRLEARRRAAIKLVETGLSSREVAEQFDVSQRSVERWRQAVREEGDDGLTAREHPGGPAKLTDEQKQQLPDILRRGAKSEGFPTDLWTCDRVKRVVERKFGVSYHPGHVSRILKDMNCSRQQPERRAKERDDKAAERWRGQDWPRIKKGSNQRC